jgi:hypothetical protein
MFVEGKISLDSSVKKLTGAIHGYGTDVVAFICCTDDNSGIRMDVEPDYPVDWAGHQFVITTLAEFDRCSKGKDGWQEVNVSE